ncbi:MAG TPA: DUF4157 domain-containing protein [Longimicrobium sp.]|nr:DUF4157 domain-containing protein [Longimicrobium sp.]
MMLAHAQGQASPAVAPPIVHDVLRGTGRPLDAAARADLEPRFGHSFADVRVHAEGRAAESARAVGAHAYTVGRSIVFGAGRYAPGTPAGRALLAHELAHTLQQQRGAAPPSGALEVGAENDAAEGQAERMAASAVRGAGATPSARHGLRVMRATRTFSLTFDDGPHVGELGKGTNLTEKVLETLKSKGIKGAFFVQTGPTYRGNHPVGRKLVARMQAEGHKVGVHTGGQKDHELHTRAAKAGRLEGELEAAKSYIKKETGVEAAYVRPPEGVYDKKVSAIYAKTGLTNLMWDIDGDRGTDLPLKTLKSRVVSEMTVVRDRGWTPSTASPNIVVLYHDVQKGSANNLGTLIDHIKDTTRALTDKKDTAAFAAP